MLFSRLPPEIINQILEFEGYHKYRKGKYIKQISRNDERYKLLKTMPKIRSHTTNRSININRPMLLEHKDSREHTFIRSREPSELRPINSIHIPKLPLLLLVKSENSDEDGSSSR